MIKTPFTRAKKIGTARQIFGTVLTILRHGTPNFRRVNVSVPNVMWHRCSREVVSARVNVASHTGVFRGVRVSSLPVKNELP